MQRNKAWNDSLQTWYLLRMVALSVPATTVAFYEEPFSPSKKNTSIDSITANALYLIFIVAFFSYPTDRANIPNFGIHTVKILNGNHLHECSTDVL